MKYIKKYNESVTKKIEDYFIEIIESDLGTVEVDNNTISIYASHDVDIKDSIDILDTDSRMVICLKEIDYFKLLNKCLYELKLDYDIKIKKSYDDLTYFVITLISKGLETFYEIGSEYIYIHSDKLTQINSNLGIYDTSDNGIRIPTLILYYNGLAKNRDLSSVNKDIIDLKLDDSFEVTPHTISTDIIGPYYGIKIKVKLKGDGELKRFKVVK